MKVVFTIRLLFFNVLIVLRIVSFKENIFYKVHVTLLNIRDTRFLDCTIQLSALQMSLSCLCDEAEEESSSFN